MIWKHIINLNKLRVPAVLVAVFIIAFSVRISFINDTGKIASINSGVPGMDISLHWRTGEIIRTGSWQEGQTIELLLPSSPLFPNLLAFTRTVFGGDIASQRWLMAMIGAFSCVLIWLLLRSITPFLWIAALGTTIWMLMPAMLFFDTVLHKTSIVMALLLLAVLVLRHLQKLGQHTNSPYLLALGALVLCIVCGVAYWLQQNTVFFFVGFLLVLVAIAKQRQVKPLTIAKCSGLAAGIFVVMVMAAEGSWLQPSSEQKWFQGAKGVHAYLGFHAESDGTLKEATEITAWPEGFLFEGRMLAEASAGRPLSLAEVDRFYFAKIWQRFKSEPVAILQLQAKKLALLFNNFESRGAEYLYWYKPLTKWLAWNCLGLGVLVSFSGLGMLALWREDKMLMGLCIVLLAASAIPQLFTFVGWRYRLPIYIPLIILGTKGIELLYITMKRSWENRNNKPHAKAVAFFWLLLAAPSALAYWPIIDDETHTRFLKGVEYNERLAEAAIIENARVAELENKRQRTQRESEELLHLLFGLRQHDKALPLAKQLIQAEDEPSMLVIRIYTRYLLWLGDYEKAKLFLSNLEQNNPRRLKAVVLLMNYAEKAVYDRFLTSNNSPKQD